MKLQLPLSLLGSVAALLLLLSGCDPETSAEKPAEPSAEERCAALACASGQCMEGDAGALVCQPEGTLLDKAPSGSERLEAAGEKRVYLFRATAGAYYRFRITSPQSQWRLEMFGPSGTQVASGEYTFFNPSKSDIEAVHKVLVDGLYTVVVTLQGAAPASYDYALLAPLPDDHGEELATATPVTFGATTEGLLDVPLDSDAFAWTAEARRIYQVRVEGTLTGVSLRLVEAATNRLLASESFGTDSYQQPTRGSTLYVPAPAAGRVLLSVSGTDALLSRGDYTVRVEALGLDDHSGHKDLATQLQVPTPPTGGALDYPGDVDAFRFSATAGHIYRVRCTPSTLPGCIVWLQNAAVTQRASAHTELYYEALESEEHLIELTGMSTGSYTYSLEDLGPDDHGTTPASATGLQPGVSTRGVIEMPNDVDGFTLPLQAGRRYRVTCAAGAQLPQCSLGISAPDGETVGISELAALAVLEFEAKTSGTHRAFVKSDGSTTGEYTVRLEDLGVDNPGQ